ncbi:type 1 glutamine amidotransferase domain-containing protein [Rhodopirellula sp. P2]|uniref:type 1 glutamine amidotransferase domain-containing protein n=1 Tax=Rhodopirellula sp. P2 TaxID=2127060 RepID=UPI0023679262|nr:type 1 glutamine amidotransferase domain-containing protein [Rhodopirellula sp. P2]WDQ16661.1 type 1 glutamine amidotransferase domain-containing protein [Rhodopirellula sp. P2]
MKRLLLIALSTATIFSSFQLTASSQTESSITKPDASRVDVQPVLFVLTSHSKMGDLDRKTGYYVPEAAHPWKVLTDAGIAVEFASVKGGEPPADALKLEDPVVNQFWTNPQVRKQLASTRPIAQVNPSDYSAILVVGGHGAMWDLPDNETLQRILAKQYDSGGVVAAVCHGPAALVNVKLRNGRFLVDGKTVAAFTDDEERAVGLADTVPFLLSSSLSQRGATMQKAANFQSSVVADGRLITGQNPASAEGVGKRILEAVLKGR